MRLSIMIRDLRARSVLALAGLALFAACDGPNRFASPLTPSEGTGDGGADTSAPSVEIQVPRGDSLSAKPLGDSVLVRARVTDDVGLDSVVFVGFAERGDPDLGTDEIVERFESKRVELDGVRDTVLSRFLIATPDPVRETANIVVLAYDPDGNVGADTVRLVLGGPEVSILDVEDGLSVQAGRPFGFRVAAADPQGVIQVSVDFSGGLDTTLTQNLPTATFVDTVRFEVTIPELAGAEVQMIATARNALDVSGQDGPITLQVVGGQASDTTPPKVQADADASARMELGDSLSVSLTARDDAQGSGVALVGVTVLGISPARGDTLERTQERTFDPARTGTVSETFRFGVFNVDSLNLPDTLVYEVVGYAIDEAGNCSASIGADSLAALPCSNLPSGAVVAEGRLGQRLSQTVVAGRTVRLPDGGRIMDAAVDTLRRNLYLSNIDQDRVEVFRLQEERFLNSVPVGSEPWGLSLNRTLDTLIVGNSGGTNLSNVWLGLSDGLGPFGEDAQRRLLTPDVVLFDVERILDDVGFIRYNVTVIPDETSPSFSDRPQFMAVDSTGRILYSTKVTELGDFGTIRKAYVPEGVDLDDPALRPEVKLFFEHAALQQAPDFVAVGNIDEAGAVPQDGDDLVILRDHEPGFPNRPIPATSTALPLGEALAELTAAGSDVVAGTGRWSVSNLGFSDTTYVTASGDGGWVVFGEGSVDPVGRIIMYNAAEDRVSGVIEVSDLMTNAAETVRGIGLNYDGTQGVARGFQAYFYTTDLRLQGVADLPSGGAGAVLHPLHANAPSLDNSGGTFHPDTHIAFLGTGERTIDIINTFHFFRMGRIFIRDIISGPLRASLPFPEDQPEGASCPTEPVFDQAMQQIPGPGALKIFEGNDFNTPYAADGGADGAEDSCIALKLYGVSDSGGVVVIDVRKVDVLRDHPTR